MMPAAVTTVIPTFRRPHLLKRAIRSALNQSHDAVVVRVFDNASGDETGELVANIMKRDSRVRYFCQPENIGLVRNFQYGMSQVDTPYFSFLGDDDLLLPHLYQEAVAALEREPSAMFFACATIYVELDGTFKGQTLGDWENGLYHPPAGLYRILRAGIPFWTGVVFRREVASRVGLLPEAGVVLDRDFLIRIAAKFPFVVSKTPGAVFSSNPSSPVASMTLDELWDGGLTIMRNMAQAVAPEYQETALQLFQRELGSRIVTFAQNAAINGSSKDALEAAQLLEDRLNSPREAWRIRLLVILSGFGLTRPLRFAADSSRSLRHLPNSLRILIEGRKYRKNYQSLVAELSQAA